MAKRQNGGRNKYAGRFEEDAGSLWEIKLFLKRFFPFAKSHFIGCLQSEYVHVNNKKYEYLGNLSPGCKGITYAYAKELRQEKTQAEEKLWPLLRNRKLKGKKFRRQHPLANYILDF